MPRHIRVGITHGDINGVGYEVIFKTLSNEGITELFTPVIFGYKALAEESKRMLDLKDLPINVVDDARKVSPGKINLVELSTPQPQLQPGQISSEAGKVAVEALNLAVEALKNGDIDVLVTAPISKEATHGENFDFPGHTEFLEDRIGEGNKAIMILCNDALRVALLTVHLPLSKVAESVTQEGIVESVTRFSETLKRDFSCDRPKIAVLSLNPHSGDGGLIGTEEDQIISPALQTLRNNKILAFGPYAADGFFGHGDYKGFDGVFAMYHDQGLAPFKTIATSGGVNFTSGLPFVRTSPDHGTAFGIAWQGKADATSMMDAIFMAIDIYRRRMSYDEAASSPLKKYGNDRHDKNDRQDKSLE